MIRNATENVKPVTTEKPKVERKFVKTELAKPKPGGRGLEYPWTGYWPSNLDEMPLSDHRDTACPWVRFRENSRFSTI